MDTVNNYITSSLLLIIRRSPESHLKLNARKTGQSSIQTDVVRQNAQHYLMSGDSTIFSQITEPIGYLGARHDFCEQLSFDLH